MNKYERRMHECRAMSAVSISTEHSALIVIEDYAQFSFCCSLPFVLTHCLVTFFTKIAPQTVRPFSTGSAVRSFGRSAFLQRRSKASQSNLWSGAWISLLRVHKFEIYGN